MAAPVTTTIQFIGLMVTRLIIPNPNNPATGALLTDGDFGSGAPGHQRLLAYEQGTRTNPVNEWNPNGPTFKGCDGKMYDSIKLVNENIDVTGPNPATDPFIDKLGAISHLQCCCPQFTQWLPEWGDPAQKPPAGRNSAFVTVNAGTYTTMSLSTPAVYTESLFHDNVPVTFTGFTPGGVGNKKLVVKSGASVIISNATIDALQCTIGPVMNDFKNYYRMGKNVGNQCNDIYPSDSPNCKPVTVCPTGNKPVKAKAVLTAEERARILRIRLQNNGDINCGSSQWP